MNTWNKRQSRESKVSIFEILVRVESIVIPCRATSFFKETQRTQPTNAPKLK
jgi:hypothetical protein